LIMLAQAAIAADRPDILEELLEGVGGQPAANPNGALNSGKTYLGLAASAGLYKIAAALLSHGADPNLLDANGDSPLHLAAGRDNTDVARLLLDAGAIAGIIDVCTLLAPLHFAPRALCA
jgi:ankyrin repeat protein